MIRTNLFPYPSAETTVGWISNTAGGVNVTSVNTAYAGTKGVRVHRDSGSGPISAYFGSTTSGSLPNADSFPVTPGDTFVFSAWVLAGPGQAALTVQALLVWQTDTAFASFTTGVGVANNAATWVRISVTGVAPAGATKVGIEVRNNSGTSLNSGNGWIMDAFLLEKNNGLLAWFDGSSVIGDLYHSWVGTPHASQSLEDTTPPGAVLLLDDTFNRANSTTVIGSPQTGPAPVVHSGVGGISSNQLYASTTTLVATWDLGTPNIDLRFLMANINSVYASVVIGFVSVTDYWYMSFRGNETVDLYRVAPGAAWLVAAGTRQSMPTDNTSLCKVTYRDGVLKAFVNNKLSLRWEVDAPITATKHGIRLNSTSTRVDNVMAMASPPLNEPVLEAVIPEAPAFAGDGSFAEPGFVYRGRDTKIQDETAGA